MSLIPKRSHEPYDVIQTRLVSQSCSATQRKCPDINERKCLTIGDQRKCDVTNVEEATVFSGKTSFRREVSTKKPFTNIYCQPSTAELAHVEDICWRVVSSPSSSTLSSLSSHQGHHDCPHQVKIDEYIVGISDALTFIFVIIIDVIKVSLSFLNSMDILGIAAQVFEWPNLQSLSNSLFWLVSSDQTRQRSALRKCPCPGGSQQSSGKISMRGSATPLRPTPPSAPTWWSPYSSSNPWDMRATAPSSAWLGLRRVKNCHVVKKSGLTSPSLL